jgi:flagellar biosynthesis protein FliR
MEPILELLIPFLLILGRVSGLFFALPVFSIEVIPAAIRGGAAAVISLALSFTIPIVIPDDTISALLCEIVLGLIMGFAVRLALVAIEVAGEVMGMQMGFGFAQLTDPMTREVKGPLTQIFLMGGAAMFLATGAHVEVFRALAASFTTVPPGSFAHLTTHWLETSLRKMGETFALGLRIGAPLILVAFATHVSFGLLTRVAPQLNVWALGFLFTIGTGLIAVTLFSPVITMELKELVQRGVDDLTYMVVP